MKSINIFYSYSHIDENFRIDLEKHLSLLKRKGVINDWHDRKIMPGDEWEKSINQNLEKAEIIILLISADFIASDYCFEEEMEIAMNKQENKTAIVLPIILRPCDWADAPFSKLQVLPKNGRPITSWDNTDDAWTDVSIRIRQICEKIKEEQQ